MQKGVVAPARFTHHFLLHGFTTYLPIIISFITVFAGVLFVASAGHKPCT